MEIRELRAFTAVADDGSFSAAAGQLHVSQSALSQTIRSLERQLGVRLLERHSAGVTVTDAGEVLLREARGLIAQHDRILAAVTGQAAAGPASLRVGVPLELPGSLLPRALADMGAAFPQTRAEISHASSAAQLAALAVGDLDLALARECPPGSGYDAVLVAEEPLGVLLSAAERAGGGSVWLHQLADLEWAGFSRAESPAWHDQVTGTLRSHGIEIRDRPGPGGQGTILKVKLAAVGTGQAFALAPPGWAVTMPDAVTWCPLVGPRPTVRPATRDGALRNKAHRPASPRGGPVTRLRPH